MPNPKAIAEGRRKKSRIFRYISDYPGSTTNEIVRDLHINPSTTWRYLRQLRDEGKIIQEIFQLEEGKFSRAYYTVEEG